MDHEHNYTMPHQSNLVTVLATCVVGCLYQILLSVEGVPVYFACEQRWCGTTLISAMIILEDFMIGVMVVLLLQIIGAAC